MLWELPNIICLAQTEITMIILKEISILFLKKIFIYLFLDRGDGKLKEGEKHKCVVASHVPPTGDLAGNPGICPDWELNQQPRHMP